MSALVCGKRSSSIFEELAHSPPPSVSKRARCCFAGAASPTTPALRPSPALSIPCFDGNDSGSGVDIHQVAAHIAHLRFLFPEMDPQLLQRALEESGHDLASAVKCLDALRLESAEINLMSTQSKTEAVLETKPQVSAEGITNDCKDATAPIQPAEEHPPRDRSEWVELFVRGMMNASDMNDARSRSSQMLGVLEKSITARAGAEAMKSLHKENTTMKEKTRVLLGENNLLKRAVAMQHDRQKNYDEICQESQHLNQLVSQYQEQLRTLEVNNFALKMHLKEAQHSRSIPGRFHPDIF
ncbi:uncharacterized protein LOC135636158 [Musa acuminata AAA Group]|uniref:uncharacterized protein LOC135636158 n=1 Tax=Musa acuminata AAA Group TaxID=214697 RepID=UPI0031D04EBD